MRRTSRHTLLASALLAAAVAAQPAAYHDATSAQHQAHFDNLSGLGFRMIALTIYGTASDLRYAAIWVQRAGPHFVGIHDATAAQYQAFVDLYCPLGYTPTILTATGSAANPRFAAALERTNRPCYVRHGLGEADFTTEVQNARDNGWRIATADVYGTAGDPRYIVAFEQHPAGQNQVISAGTTSYQQHFDAFGQGWSRPRLVAFNDDQRFLSVWQNDSVGDWLAHHDMTSAQYQNLFDGYAMQGLFPIALHASGSGAARRFAAVWAPTDLPLSRAHTTTGVAVPELSMFDDWVRSWMQQRDARAAALAIVKDARLVLARGYTWAEPGYPITAPTSLFAIASCTKPLTSIAVHQHFERRPASIQPTSPMIGFFAPSSMADSRTALISVFQLLTHQGGWDRNVSFDPMIRDVAITQALGIPLPITKTDIRTYMTQTQVLDFAPGTQSQYSNYGYSLLGQILERLNPGLSYEQIMNRDVFGPLGVTRARVRGALIGDVLPGEVRYHLPRPAIAQSVNSVSRPWVASQYGALNQTNMDSHGAWVMAAPDFAKVLGAFDLGAGNPLLGLGQTAAMWTVPPGYSTLMRGWYRENVGDGDGGSVMLAHHNGRLFGAVSVIARRADGISFVLFTNSDVSPSGQVEGVQLSDLANTVPIWPNHDLFPSVSLPPFRSRTPGTFSSFGQGCGAGATALALAGSGTPELEQVFALDLSNARASLPAFALIAFDRSPLDLGAFGAAGCVLYGSPVASFPTATGRTGTARVSIMVPDVPSLIGNFVFGQYVVLDAQANLLGARTSNGLSIRIGGWQ